MASKNSLAKGRPCASAWMGKTCCSRLAARMRCQLSPALTHKSVAHTCSWNSWARKMEVIAFPQPRSITRALDSNSMTWLRDSASQRGLLSRVGIWKGGKETDISVIMEDLIMIHE